MEKSHVTMEQHLCPICGKVHDSGAILMDRKLRKTFDMHTTTGYGLCENCKKRKEEGYMALVVCDPTKSTIENDTVKIANAYRTGQLIHIKKTVAEKMFNKEMAKHDMVFIDTELAKKLEKINEGLDE